MTDFSPSFAETDFLERLASLESPPPYVLLPQDDAQLDEVRAAGFVLLTQDKKQLLSMLAAYPLLREGQGGGFVVPGLAPMHGVIRQVDDGTFPLAWAQDLIANRVALPLASGRVIWRVVASEESALRLYGRCIHSRQQRLDFSAAQWQDLARALSRFDALPTQPKDTTLAFNAAAAQVLTYLTVGFGISPVPEMATLISDTSTKVQSCHGLTGRVLVQAAHQARLPDLARQWQTLSCQVHIFADDDTQAAQWRLREPGLTLLNNSADGKRPGAASGDLFDALVIHDLAAWSLQNADGPSFERGVATLFDQRYDLAEVMQQGVRKLLAYLKPGGRLIVDQVAFGPMGPSGDGLNLGYYPLHQALQAECPWPLQTWAAWPGYGTWFQWSMLADGGQADGVLNLGLAQIPAACITPEGTSAPLTQNWVQRWPIALRHGQGLALSVAWCCVAHKPCAQDASDSTDHKVTDSANPKLAYQWRQGPVPLQAQAFMAQNPLLMPGAKTAQHDFFLLASQDGWTLARLAQALTRYIHAVEAVVPQLALGQWLRRPEQESDLQVSPEGIACLCQAMPDRVGLQADGTPFFVPNPDDTPPEALLQAVVNQEATLTPSRWLLAVLVVMLRGTPQWGEQAQKRRFTRLQWAENQLAHMGWNWLASDWQRDNIQSVAWLAEDMLPTPTPAVQVAERDARILQLEEQLHYLQTDINVANEKVGQLTAIAEGVTADVRRVVTQEVSADISLRVREAVVNSYESTLSWRVTLPLRKAKSFMSRLRRRSLTQAAPQSVPLVVVPEPLTPLEPALSPGELVTGPDLIREFVLRHQRQGPAPAQPHDPQGLPRFDYARWVQSFDQHDVFDLADQQRRLTTEHHLPRLGFICLPSNTVSGHEALAALLGDLLAQPYTEWDMVVLVSPLAPLDALCAGLCAADARLHCVQIDANASLSACLQTAWPVLPQAVERLTLITPDTRLNWAGLTQLARDLRAHPEGQLRYTDCDILNAQGQRHQPHFKPDWNEALFFSSALAPKAHHSLVSGLLWATPACWKTLTLPPCAPDYEGWHLANLALTLQVLSLATRPSQAAAAVYEPIRHLPLVMAHLPSATVQAVTRDKGLLQLRQHFERLGHAVDLHLTDQGVRLSWPLPAVTPQSPVWVSVIIPTRNNPHLLRQCVSSMLEKTRDVSLELIVVDNGSDTPEALETLRDLSRCYPQVRVLRDSSPFNYSALNNHAVSLARGKWVALVNDDIEVTDGQWLAEMLRQAARPNVGVVGAKLLYPDGTVQHAGVFLVGTLSWHAYRHFAADDPGHCGQALLARDSSCLTAACILVRKSLYEQVGGLDAEQLTVGWNDTDFCLKVLAAGYQNVWTPDACLVHHESATRGQDQTPEKKVRAEREWRTMQARWGKKMMVDPAYSPNLSCGYEDFSWAWPPRAEKYLSGNS